MYIFKLSPVSQRRAPKFITLVVIVILSNLHLNMLLGCIAIIWLSLFTHLEM